MAHPDPTRAEENPYGDAFLQAENTFDEQPSQIEDDDERGYTVNRESIRCPFDGSDQIRDKMIGANTVFWCPICRRYFCPHCKRELDQNILKTKKGRQHCPKCRRSF